MWNVGVPRDVAVQLAGVTANAGDQALDRLDADAAFEIDALGALQLLVAAAVHDRAGIADHADLALHVQAPVSRGAELHAVGEHVLDIAVAVEVFDEGNPGKVRRADPDVQRVADLGFAVGLLDVDVGQAGGAVVGKVGRHRDMEDVVELVIDAQIEALHIEANTVLGRF